mgnify:CR=1 FL=1
MALRWPSIARRWTMIVDPGLISCCGAYLYQLQKKNRLATDDPERSIELNATVEARVMRGKAYEFCGDVLSYTGKTDAALRQWE